MDFWDITKLLARRWMFFVPLLLACGALTVLATAHLRPSYVATSYVQLVPPVIVETQPGQATARERNPWIGLGLQTIGNAAIVTVTDTSVSEQLRADGYSGSYTVTMGLSTPLITFAVVADSPAQANATTEQVVDRFDQSVTALQASYGVKQADMITSHRLDVGTNIKASNSKVKRTVVALVGADLLVTIAVTIGLDALLRRRRRRREMQVAAPAAVIEPTQVPGPEAGPRLNGWLNGDLPTAQIVTTSSAGEAGDGDGRSFGLNLELAQPQGLSAAGSDEAPQWEHHGDATIVLPRLPGPNRPLDLLAEANGGDGLSDDHVGNGHR